MHMTIAKPINEKAADTIDVSANAPRVNLSYVPTPLNTASAFYSAWNHGDWEDAAQILDSNVSFRDINMPEPFAGRERVRSYLEDCSTNLVGWQFCIDDWAEDQLRKTLTLRWHVNDVEGNPLPIPSQGISFLGMTAEGDKIAECTDINEPFAALPAQVIGSALSMTGQAVRAARSFFTSAPTKASTLDEDEEATSESAPSMVETGKRFFELWNADNSASAADLLAPDVEFKAANIEGAFHGRSSAHDFLDSYAAVMNPFDFVIDNWSEDPPRRCLGLKWHVQLKDTGNAPPIGPKIGMSFLHFNEDLTLINAVESFSEPFATPPEDLQFPIASLASRALEVRRTGSLDAARLNELFKKP